MLVIINVIIVSVLFVQDKVNFEVTDFSRKNVFVLNTSIILIFLNQNLLI